MNNELQAILDDYIQPDDPAVVFLIATSEGTITAAQGMANVAEGMPVQVDDLFRIGSVTKTWVAVAALKMAAEGLIGLDDPIAGYLPDDILDGIPYADQITIRQLLNMTAGTFDYLDNDDFWDEVEDEPEFSWTVDDVLEYVLDEDPEFAPGEDWAYSNTNYVLLQLVMEQAAGQNLAAILRQRVIEPLDLQHTFFEHGDTVSGEPVRSYKRKKKGKWKDISHVNDGRGSAAGGLVSNAEDVAVFIWALTGGQLLPADWMQQMTDFVATPDDEGYGLGYMWVETDYGRAYGHNGTASGFTSEMWHLPDRNAIYVLLMASEDLDLEDLVADGLEAVLGS